jgi:hypothetical protein
MPLRDSSKRSSCLICLLTGRDDRKTTPLKVNLPSTPDYAPNARSDLRLNLTDSGRFFTTAAATSRRVPSSLFHVRLHVVSEIH